MPRKPKRKTTAVEKHKTNFETLRRAFREDAVGLLEVRERATGAVRVALATFAFYKGEFHYTPFALFLDGNPFELLDPPNPDGGFYAP